MENITIIQELLEDKINDVFIEMQDKLNIVSGDIDPLDELKLETKTNQLAELIDMILHYQQINKEIRNNITLEKIKKERKNNYEGDL